MKNLIRRLMGILRSLLIVVVVGFAIYYFSIQWTEVSSELIKIAPLSLLLASVAVLIGIFAGLMSWITVLNGLGPRVPKRRAAQIMLVGQLGKYIPGSVWAYVMQMEIGRQYGVIRPRVLVASLYSAGIAVVASLILGGFSIGFFSTEIPGIEWALILIPVGLFCMIPQVMTFLASWVLRLFKRPPLEHQVSLRTIIVSFAWAAVSYVFFGSQLWFLANSIGDPRGQIWVLMVSGMALSFTVGLIAFFLPSGLGAREVILISVLSLVLTQSQAAAVTLISRLLLTAGDLLSAGAAVAMVLIFRRTLKLQTKTYLLEEAIYETGEPRHE